MMKIILVPLLEEIRTLVNVPIAGPAAALSVCRRNDQLARPVTWLLIALSGFWFNECAVCAEAAAAPGPTAATNAFPVSIRVDAARTKGELHRIWRFFGGDEPNYATMKDGRKLIGELGEIAPQEVYFPTHNLLH